MSKNAKRHHVLNDISLMLTSVMVGWVLAMLVQTLRPGAEQAAQPWQLSSLVFSMIGISLIPFLLTLPGWFNWTQPAESLDITN
ncbi:MAG: hypothetical protein IT320_23170 [Anaerolineae bacterium]|nr:hypothetical protein [Anaerolineae bacterium]